jgi:hypothetical protein
MEALFDAVEEGSKNPNLPKRSQEEIDNDVDYFINHPLNV